VAAGSHGSFAETNDDGVFVSRFSNDSLLYSQNRLGYTMYSTEGYGGFHFQTLWNANLTADAQRQYLGELCRNRPRHPFPIRVTPAVAAVFRELSTGAYPVNEGNPRRANYNELRVGVWYAFTH